jgi:ribonuclease VapC
LALDLKDSNQAIVLDSSAVVAILLREPGYQHVAKRLKEARVVLVGAPTILEAALVLSSRLSQDARPMLTDLFRSINAQTVPFSEAHMNVALDAFLRFGKGRHLAGLNIGDCMAYAVAHASGFPLLYLGDDFPKTDIEAA